MARLEYRVVWRREGQAGRTTRIYQGANAARRKREGILAIEQIKGGTSMSMPDLAEPPIVEVREVGPWAPSSGPLADYFSGEPSEATVRAVTDAMTARYPKHDPAGGPDRVGIPF